MARARSLSRVLAFPERSRHLVGAFVDPQSCPSHSLKIFITESAAVYALLSSSIFVEWVALMGGARQGGYRLSITATVEPFALPGSLTPDLEEVGEELHRLRDAIAVGRNIGLTEIMNRQHTPGVSDDDFQQLRRRQIELDQAVLDAYGWSTIELDHGHWETPQGMRFTVSPAAKDELLDRLLELNHQRYAEEVAAGLHDKKSKKPPPKRAKAVDENQESML